MNNLYDFSKVFEAWDQPTFETNNGWKYTPAVGTWKQGYNSHFTYLPSGTLDHYSSYNGIDKLSSTSMSDFTTKYY